MREKDIENLLAKYPSEFLPNYDLTVRGQQIRIGHFHADIIFEDKLGRLIITEIKKGILERDALGQAFEYYGLYKKLEPTKEIRILLVANIISEGMMALANENLNIEFLQISASKIQSIAAKHSYKFLDPNETAQNQELGINERQNSTKRQVWIFQANPKSYDITHALSDDDLFEEVWFVGRYKNQIRIGDIGLIWISGREAGIYAKVEVKSNPQLVVDCEFSKYWLVSEDKKRERLKVKIEFLSKYCDENFFPKGLLEENSTLHYMEHLQGAIGPTFRVTDDEWRELRGFLVW